MKLNRTMLLRAALLVSLMANLTILSSNIKADTGSCGGVTVTLPFTDVMGNAFFCQIAAAYFSGLTNGTSATTYSPAAPVTREQMAAFTTRTLDQSLKRGSQRAALNQHWTTQDANSLGLTTVGIIPQLVQSDGADLWVANLGGTVSRVRASDGKLLETWNGAAQANGVLVAMGKVFVTGLTTPGSLYLIDPSQPSGTVTTLTTSLGGLPQGIAFDGARIWTANRQDSLSIITLNPFTATNVSTGIVFPVGILFDGNNMWMTTSGTNPGKLLKLDANGNILQTVTVGADPRFPAFDGTNIWVPNFSSNTVTVVRAQGALSGTVIATLTDNGLNSPQAIGFDGERIMVANFDGLSVSLWKASDLNPIGSFSVGTGNQPGGVCSDGINFWITLQNGGVGKLARF